MFIDTMSSHELLQEYRADLKEIRQKTREFDKSEYLRNYLWKRRKLPRVVIQKPTSTSRNNKYLGVYIYEQFGNGKIKNWDWASYHSGMMNTDKGLIMVMFYEESGQAVKYTPHFFQRYKERLLKVCDWKVRNQLNSATTQEQIATIYIQRNIGTAWIETKSVYKNKTHIFAPVPDGVTLLQWDSKHKTMQANTFITYDMLDEKQMEMILKLKAYSDLNSTERESADNLLFEAK